MDDYRSLLTYCKTFRQKELIQALINHNGNKDTVCEDHCILRTNLNRTIRHLKEKQSSTEPLQHLNAERKLPEGYYIKGTSVQYDRDGEVAQQWVKTNKNQKETVEALYDAVNYIVEAAEGRAKPSVQLFQTPTANDLLNVYISNDLHFGAMAWAEETQDRDYTLDIADELLESAMNNLIVNSPNAKQCIVADLGDMTEMDDFKNATPASGHSLDVDGRYSKVIRVAMEAMVKLIDKALQKHEIVHFINISGNHDITTGHATRAFVSAWYRNEPRVVVCDKPTHQKYFKHGKTLLGFAHGDGLKMPNAGELMAVQCADIFSDTVHRFFHFGHNHKDKIVDGRICKAESHRNLAPLNSWASHAGFTRQLGTMKCITYCPKHGELSRNLFNVGMTDED